MGGIPKTPPKFFEWLLRKSILSEDSQYISADLEEEFYAIQEEQSSQKAANWYRRNVIRALPGLLSHKFVWSIIMFYNYMKVALRNIERYRGFTFINVFGLAAGLICCMLILLFVQFEFSYDSYHEDVDRMYLVRQIRKSAQGTEYYFTNMTGMGEALRNDFPQVESGARVVHWTGRLVKYKTNMHYEDYVIYAEPDYFSLFSVEFIEGDPSTAISRPKTAVITEKIAAKYFPDENPVGAVIIVDSYEVEVTGIIKNSRINTSSRYDIIVSWETIMTERFMENIWHPGAGVAATYIKIKKGVDPEEFEEIIAPAAHTYAKEALEQRGLVYTNFLQPVRDIHLFPRYGNVSSGFRNLDYIYMFAGIGILILLLACINFMNLSTARSANRACEVGMRKVVGAVRKQLVWQFMNESLILALVAFFLALLGAILLLPVFNDIANTQFGISDFFDPGIIVGLVLLVLVVGIISGSYPALIMSRFKPVSVLRGAIHSGAGSRNFRRILVVAQFSVTIALLIGTMLVHDQIRFMKERPLGFDRQQKYVIKLSGWDLAADKWQQLRESFLLHSGVSEASFGSGVPGRGINRLYVFLPGLQEESGFAGRCLRCGPFFIDQYKLEIIAGRNFSMDVPTDIEKGVFLLNEKAVKKFGWSSPEEAIGKEIWDRRIPVVGVVKDFHWFGLQREIEPMVIRCVPSMGRFVSLTVDTGNMDGALAHIEKVYRDWQPNDIYDTFFVDTDFDLQYRFEEKVGSLFGIFTALGIIIACLGLFGLASFIAEKRTKEIGIRKALGASENGLVILLTREFVRWVIISAVIAFPAAYYGINTWLTRFPYRISPGPEAFIAAFLITLIIAVLTVSWQSYRAARSNPVDSLRYE